MKKYLFLLTFSISFLLNAGERSSYLRYISPICNFYHNQTFDYCIFLPPESEEWNILEEENLLSIKYNDANFFSIFTSNTKYNIDCRTHFRFEEKLMETAKKVVKEHMKNIEITKTEFMESEDFKMSFHWIDSSPYIFIEGLTNGKKSFHFLTSYQNQWFDFFYILDNSYYSILSKKLFPFFNSIGKIYGIERLDEVYLKDFFIYKPKEIIESFFMLFLFDISAKAEETEWQE
jgi:hypothetical protein